MGDTYFPSPILAGFISSVAHSSPINHPAEFDESLIQNIGKEISASIFEYRPTQFDYQSIFSTRIADRSIPLADNLESTPDVAQSIHESLLYCRSSFQNMVLYPKCGNKTVGQRVQRSFWASCSEELRAECYEESLEFGGVTTSILQKMEFWDGHRVDGPVEVRTSWKYSQMKPRIYFAQGGSTFHTSKYVQAIFNRIADSLEMVHTKNRYIGCGCCALLISYRYFPPEEELIDSESVLIYDYSSFTSTLDEIRSFIHYLALFMQGVTVYLIGDKDGPVATDLGDLLHRYNLDCNSDALFDVDRVSSFDDPDFLLRHTCGMLGVPGDIQSKTILHGIHTAFICMSLRKSRCVGDDAWLQVHLGNQHDRVLLENRLQNLGRIEYEKAEEFEYDDEDDYELRAWQYVKRPILRVRNRILQFFMEVFPTLDCILGLSQSGRTIPPKSLELNSRRSKFSNVWLRLITQITFRYVVQPEEADFLYRYQRVAFEELEITGKRPGTYHDGDQIYFVPPFLQASDFGNDFKPVVCALYDPEEVVKVLRVGSSRVAPQGYISEKFESASSPMLGFMGKMGIVKKKVLTDEITRLMVGDDAFVDLLLGRLGCLYEYEIVREFPSWMLLLLP